MLRHRILGLLKGSAKVNAFDGGWLGISLTYEYQRWSSIGA